ncbi:MAG: hypothetical protein ACW98D_21745 [Promethearchaeota archaeon]|jgi:hypothetical protein
MTDTAKQLLKEMNKPLHERLKIQFISYLRDIEQDNLIELAQKVEWEIAAKLFEVEYAKLWNKMSVPKLIDGLEGLKKEFARVLLTNIKPRLFHSTYSYLKNIAKENKINDENIDELMKKLFDFGMYELFRVFDYQFTLASLNKNNDKKVMNKKIEDLRKRAEFGDKFLSKNQEGTEEKVFKMIDEELERRERLGQRWSARAACDYYGRNELGYDKDGNQPEELDNFYKRYLAYSKQANTD